MSNTEKDTIFDEICGALPSAEWADPSEGSIGSWKVGGKMFACVGTQREGISVKCADVEMAQMLIDAGAAIKAPYFHASWVRIPFDAPRDELAHRIQISFDLIASKLTKKRRLELGIL
jgi:predicted DNA-binding protein (MmcQ/YjbR family)